MKLSAGKITIAPFILDRGAALFDGEGGEW
jgi:hypothetical protein